MLRTLSLGGLLLLALLTACPGGGDEPFDGGTLGAGGECTVQDDCFGCGVCRLPYDEVCLEGQCWLSGPPDRHGDPMVGSYLVIATFPDELDRNRILSGAIRILDKRKANGETLTCAELMADPIATDADPLINRVRTLEPRLQIPATADQSAMGVTAGLGEDRLIFVRIHEETNGVGTLLSLGCVEGVDIVLGAECTDNAGCERPRICELAGADTGYCGPISVEVPLSMP
ncbi:MAG: hypothetical protein P1V51_07835 [Deltaproteobacteria bacterium]|nr:hypothetical protein [Deltaproteobacteria bacterium]